MHPTYRVKALLPHSINFTGNIRRGLLWLYVEAPIVKCKIKWNLFWNPALWLLTKQQTRTKLVKVTVTAEAMELPRGLSIIKDFPYYALRHNLISSNSCPAGKAKPSCHRNTPNKAPWAQWCQIQVAHSSAAPALLPWFAVMSAFQIKSQQKLLISIM